MRAAPGSPSQSAIKGGLGEWLSYGLLAGSLWLGWNIVQAALIDRAPPNLAVRLAPNSPEALRRASETALIAGASDRASALADASLQRAPFNARALRVRGLAAAKAGQEVRANELLTLAGNWSLRDDAAHSWLVEYRLRQGDYGSSFAHADTLVRRREDMYPRVFRLFTAAAMQDPRATPHLVRLLAASPPWRTSYIYSLYESDVGLPLLITLAVALEQTSAPFSQAELQNLYQVLSVANQWPTIALLREKLKRPLATDYLQNGGFSDPPAAQILPFTWRLGMGPGLAVEILGDDLRPENDALRVDYDGYGSAPIAEQILVLPAGQYSLSGKERIETSPQTARLSWFVTCIESGARVAEYRPSTDARSTNAVWRSFSVPFAVPNSQCTAQRIQLMPLGGGRRNKSIAWFDDLAVARPETGSR